MNTKVFLLSFLILNLSAISAHASCPTGDSRSLSYIRRDNNRCEGIRSDFNVSSGLGLISFATRGLSTLGDQMTLQIPRIDNKIPIVAVQAIKDRYLLDDFVLSPQQSYLSFSWSTYIIQKASVPINKLRAIAYIKGSQRVFVPVILGQSSDRYEFVLYASRPTRILRFEISFDSRIVHQSSKNTPQQGEILFSWDGRNAPAGRYKLNFVGEVEQFNRPPEKFPVQVTFEHNPDWLR